MQIATEMGWTNCLQQMKIHKDVVFYGDSIIRSGKWQEWFPDADVCNLGLGGDDAYGGLRRMDMLTALTPKKVFVELGINHCKEPIDNFISAYDNMLNEMTTRMEGTKLYVCSILPIHHSKYEEYCTSDMIIQRNQAIKDIVIKYSHCKYIDIFDLYVNENGEIPMSLTKDGLHLQESSYDKWVNYIRRYVYE